MTESAPAAPWRPSLPGWSDDILPFYDFLAKELPDGAQVAEIGVAWGRSLLYLAEAMHKRGKLAAKLWGVDPWPPEWDYPPEATPAAAWVFPRRPMLRTLVTHATDSELERVHLVRAPSSQAARLFAPASLDCVFIDAAHDRPSVANDCRLWAPKVKPGGILSGHDYSEVFPGVTQAVAEFFCSRALGAKWIEHPTVHPARGSSVWALRLQ